MTKFADMPQGSLNGWRLWCKSHDWSNRVYYDDTRGAFVCKEFGFPTFYATTPRALKTWAGY